MEDIAIENNKVQNRFHTTIDGEDAYIQYRIDGRKMLLMHTFVPEKLRGRRIADQLAKFALKSIETEGFTAKIYCPFISTFVKRHPEYEKWRIDIANED